MPRPDFKASAEARLLATAFQAIPVGETITYERMTELVSLPKEKLSTPLRTALRRVLKDHDMVFACVKTVGFQRLNDIEIIEEGAVHAARIRRRALRSIERQMKADFSKLSRSQQARASAQISVMGAIAMMSKEKSVQRITERIDPGVKELPTSQTLAMFTKEKDRV